MRIKTDVEYKEALIEVERLIDLDPDVKTADGDKLDALTNDILEYEKCRGCEKGGFMPTIDQQCKEICSYCADYGDEDPLDDILFYRFIEGGWCHGHWVCAASEIREAAGHD